MPVILAEHQQWLDSGGKPLVGGKVYFGVQNADPIVSPQTIFSDRDFATVILNPQILDANGRTTNKTWIKNRYSIRVDDLNDVQQYQELDNGEPGSAGITTLDNVAGSNTITATAAPIITAYVDKEIYIFKTVSINTGAVTLNIDGVGAKAIVRADGAALLAGEFAANANIDVQYNSTSDDFQWLNQIDIITADQIIANQVFGD